MPDREKRVKEIRVLRTKGLSSYEIAEKTGILRTSVNYLLWKFLPELNTPEFRKKIKSRVIKQAYKDGKYDGRVGWKLPSIDEVRKKWDGKTPIGKFAKQLGVEPTTLSKFLRKHDAALYKTMLALRYEATTGERNPRFAGGRYRRSDGYVRVRIGTNEHRLEHQLVAEQHLGRPLEKSERVHHINGVKHDNRSDNLVVCNGIKSHHAFHAAVYNEIAKRYPDEFREATRFVAKDIDGVELLDKEE
jgi:hypothetical protein